MCWKRRRMPASKHEQETHFHAQQRTHSFVISIEWQKIDTMQQYGFSRASHTHKRARKHQQHWSQCSFSLSRSKKQAREHIFFVSQRIEISIGTETVNTQGYKIQLYRVRFCLVCQMKCNHPCEVSSLDDKQSSRYEIVFNSRFVVNVCSGCFFIGRQKKCYKSDRNFILQRAEKNRSIKRENEKIWKMNLVWERK